MNEQVSALVSGVMSVTPSSLAKSPRTEAAQAPHVMFGTESLTRVNSLVPAGAVAGSVAFVAGEVGVWATGAGKSACWHPTQVAATEVTSRARRIRFTCSLLKTREVTDSNPITFHDIAMRSIRVRENRQPPAICAGKTLGLCAVSHNEPREAGGQPTPVVGVPSTAGISIDCRRQIPPFRRI